MLASPTSRWSVGAAALAVLVLVASWFLLIGPRRADASSVREQAVSAQSQADTLQIQIAQLKSQFADLPKRRAELAAITSQLPGTADIPALVRSLQDFAAASGVSLDSLAPGTPLIFTADGSAAAASATGTASAGQVVSIPISLTASGDYFEDALFIKSLQTKLDRAVLITGIAATATTEAAVTDSTTTAGATPSVAPSVAATPAAPVSSTSLQLTGSIFVLLDDQTTLDDVAEQAKSATGSAAPASATPAATASTS